MKGEFCGHVFLVFTLVTCGLELLRRESTSMVLESSHLLATGERNYYEENWHRTIQRLISCCHGNYCVAMVMYISYILAFEATCGCEQGGRDNYRVSC